MVVVCYYSSIRARGAASITTSISALLGLLRPRQWIKNSFVLAPLVFAREYLELRSIEHALLAFGLFCLASSACYIVNDIHDRERDRAHPVKRLKRPLAAGTATVRTAVLLLLLLYALLIAGFVELPPVALPILAYIVLNLAYTWFLKDQPVLDIFSIAIGFVLRVYAGAEALDVPLSSWMAITTLCLALYLASIKRRQELHVNGTDARHVLKEYSITLVDRYAEMSAVGALIFYSLFVMTTNNRLSVTIPLVIFGLFRYWYVVDTKAGGESPTDVLLTDWPLVLCILAWGAMCVLALTL
jgi:4-hydroxybenzoate polyprenyltransferase